jgi:hypothetical protein
VWNCCGLKLPKKARTILLDALDKQQEFTSAAKKYGALSAILSAMPSNLAQPAANYSCKGC